ncbi:zinc finger protein 628 [Astyanax mexicanus]|uniref:Zinc finger protein 628-like n=2 Tax=Astyanax mexicanus TaxID=7994 RepID=A0A8T2MKX8_ASTMX|nr:zinc finger protein 628 [Astyanax mexicanus]KAG9282116.1 zinc finger protein 628-like [Astyanax mexicanus]
MKRSSAGENAGGAAGGSGSHRKQSIINSSTKCCGKAERIDHFHGTLSITSLRSRLGPTIRSTLSAAVDTLLGEIVAVMSETHGELRCKEQENEKLKVRLEVSERELKTLQDCLCSAQKLIDQLQGPFTSPPLPPHHHHHHHHGYPSPQTNPVGPGRLGHRGAGDATPAADPRCFAAAPGPPGPAPGEPELSGALGDAIHGFDSRDDFKSCHLSIQADGTVTNSYYDPMAVHSAGMCHDVNRTGEMSDRRLSHPASHPPYPVKEEQIPSTSGPVCVRGNDSERSAQSVCDLGYIHVVEEEGGGSRPHSHPPKPTPTPPSSGSHNGPSSQSPPPQGPSGLGTSQRDASGAGGRSPGASPEVRRRRSASELMGEAPGDRPHLCMECGKTFRLVSSLKKHLRIHTGEKPYPCAVCGRRFRESGALKTHLRIHTGEKPYSCSECGTRFRHLDGLRKHRRTHTGEKPYVCAVCGKRLSRLQHLKQHQRIHTGEPPTRCPLCRRAFQDAAALRKHLRHHQGEPGLEEVRDRLGLEADEEEDGDPNLQGPIEDEEMRFGMWGEEEREEGEAPVDCV